MNIKKLKDKLPYYIRQFLKYIYGSMPMSIRYGRVFRKTVAFLEKSQWWTADELENYQKRQMDHLLRHAYENVSYYRRVFDERGFKPDDIQTIGDLKKIPYLTKETIKKELPNLIAKNYSKRRLRYVTTGGSTGVPLGVYWEDGITESKEKAFVGRWWKWVGVNLEDRKAILRGTVINRFKNSKRQWWEYAPFEKSIILSSFDIAEETVHVYANVINDYKPIAIQAYPSSLYALTCFLKKNDITLTGLKCIFTSSETLYSYQRDMIEEFLGVKIYDLYGNTERNVLITQCEKMGYHIISEYGVTELIDAHGESVTEEGQLGEIVGTGFNNYAMPLIRYKTDDFAIYSKKECSCGRHYPLVERLEGRLQDFMVARDMHLISILSVHLGKLKQNDYVDQFQFYQDTPGEVVINIVKRSNYSKEEEGAILESVSEGFENKINFNIEHVANTERTKSGKYRLLVQHLPIQIGDPH